MIGTVVYSCASRLTAVSSSETCVTTANKIHSLGLFFWGGGQFIGLEVVKSVKRTRGGEGGRSNNRSGTERELFVAPK